jgi:hypothetical protein
MFRIGGAFTEDDAQKARLTPEFAKVLRRCRRNVRCAALMRRHLCV